MRSAPVTSPLLIVVLLAGALGCGADSGRAETRVSSAATTPASTAAPGATAAAGAGAAPVADGALPQAAVPFPGGLEGTLAFQSDRSGRTKLYTLDLASGQVRALTTDARYRDENPRWSPDGTRIAFKSNRAHYDGPAPEQGNADYDIYTMAADGSDVRRITTNPANEHDPSWAQDGKSLIYSSEQDSRGDLYRVWLEAAPGRVERLTRHFVGRAIMPTVSPDGGKVAFGAQTLRAGQFWVFQVHVLDLASKTTTALEGSGGACWPNWRPDGQALAYVHLDSEPSALEMLNLQTRARQALVRDPKLWSYYPDWSPDGRQVAFSVSPAHHDGEDWDLAILDASQPGRFTRLTTGPGNDRLPDWKPR